MNIYRLQAKQLSTMKKKNHVSTPFNIWIYFNESLSIIHEIFFRFVFGQGSENENYKFVSETIVSSLSLNSAHSPVTSSISFM